MTKKNKKKKEAEEEDEFGPVPEAPSSTDAGAPSASDAEQSDPAPATPAEPAATEPEPAAEPEPEPEPEPKSVIAAPPAQPDPLPAPTKVASAPAAPAEEPKKPVTFEQPMTPAPADDVESAMVVVDVGPSPAAQKFLGTMGTVGEELSALESEQVSDGMYELSKRFQKSTQESWQSFSAHALDVALVATSEEAPAEGRLRGLVAATSVKKLALLPLAGVYAIVALLCLMSFACIYYPKMYAPVIIDKARSKFLEYEVSKRAQEAKEKIVEVSTDVYAKAAASQVGEKSKEAIGVVSAKATEVYSTVAAQPVVQAVAAKSGEAASQLRAKIADELVKAKAAQPAAVQDVV